MLSEIIKLFDIYGVLFFEKLDIWFLNETMSIFVSRVGRKPKPQSPSELVLKINTLKNYLKNVFFK